MREPSATTVSRTHWEVVTAAGVTIEQFDSPERARKYLAERNATRGRQLPGACVEEVETLVTRRRTWKPRLKVA